MCTVSIPSTNKNFHALERQLVDSSVLKELM
jgi:hypothetical protein